MLMVSENRFILLNITKSVNYIIKVIPTKIHQVFDLHSLIMDQTINIIPVIFIFLELHTKLSVVENMQNTTNNNS